MPPSQTRGRSTFFLLAFPLLVVAVVVLLASIQLSTRSNAETYNRLTEQQLHNNLQIVRTLLAITDTQNIETLTRPLSALPLQPGHGIALIARNGDILLNVGPADSQGLRREVLPRLIFRSSAIHTLTTPNQTLVAVLPMRGGELYLIAYSRADVQHSSWLLWVQFSGLVALLFIALVITVYMAVTDPLKNMTLSLTGILQRRRYDLRVPVAGSAELQSLGHGFNNLLEAVQSRDIQLRDHNQKLGQLVKERTAELEKTHLELLRREKMAAIGAFAAGTVHELRNPLTAMRLSLDPLRKLQNLDDKSQRRLHMVQEEAQRLENMLSDILTYAADRPTQKEKLNLNAFVEKYRDLLTDTASAHKAELHLHTEAGTLNTDENRLLQILLNLVKNAAEAGSTVELKIEKTNNRWQFAVSNNGHITPEIAARLFEPFFTTKKQGTGLGLATCKKLAEDMGGSLALTQNDGSTVTLTLSL